MNDLLVNKESFVKAFDSIEKKRSLVNALIKKVKDNSIVSDEVDRQKYDQEIDNSCDKAEAFIRKLKGGTKAALKEMNEKVRKNFIEEYAQLSQEKTAKLPFLGMKKPKTLTAADLNLAAMNQNQYMKISYWYRNDKHVGYDTNNKHVEDNTNDKRPGHAVLIKKNSDNSFAFYDPNFGAVFDLTEEQLCEVVTQSFYKYIEISKLCIVALFILSTSVVAGIAAAVYGYNIVASVSLVICLVDLSILCCLNDKLMPQMYNTITLRNNISTIDNDFQVELKNLVDKYLGDNGKSGGTAVEGDVQVESVTKENLILGNASNL